MLDVRRMRLLLELSRRGTIAAVAEALAYSPSAVSQQLGVLEKEAGTALLEPFGRRVRLTPEGEVLASHAETILTELERAEVDLSASSGAVRGTLRIAAFQSAVLTLLPDALIDLSRDHLDLRVEATEMEPEESLPALLAGDFDLALCEEYPAHPRAVPRGLERTDLVTDGLRLAVPQSWGRPDLPDLANAPFAMEPVGSTSRDWAAAACRTAGFEPDVRYTTNDLLVHLRMVERGLAAAFLPDLAQPQDRPGVTLRPLDGRPVRRIFACTRIGSTRRPAIRAALETLAG